jgi:Holliday junction resolvase RusA-like endonuclease
MEYKPDVPIKAPVRLVAKFFLKRPKNHYGTGKNAGKLKSWALSACPTTKPDLDNLVKFIKDALNGIFWYDDSYVVEIQARKKYSESPRIEIEIWDFDQQAKIDG